jgi:hypothetical protein
MFGNDPRADLTIHHQITREEINSISQDKDVCEVGYRYKDPYGNEAVYLGEGQKKPVVPNVTPDLVSKITEEVLKKLRNS